MIIREHISFERGLDSKKALDVGIHRSNSKSIKNFLEENDDFFEDDTWEWISSLPELMNALEIKDKNDSNKNIIGFEDENILSNLEDEEEYEEYWEKEIKYKSPRTKMENQHDMSNYPHKISGYFQFIDLWDRSKLIYYSIGLTSGYIARKEWIK